MKESGFELGDKFVYVSKYGGVAFGTVNDILPIYKIIVRGNIRLSLKTFCINKIYDSKEIFLYESYTV